MLSGITDHDLPWSKGWPRLRALPDGHEPPGRHELRLPQPEGARRVSAVTGEVGPLGEWSSASAARVVGGASTPAALLRHGGVLLSLAWVLLMIVSRSLARLSRRTIRMSRTWPKPRRGVGGATGSGRTNWDSRALPVSSTAPELHAGHLRTVGLALVLALFVASWPGSGVGWLDYLLMAGRRCRPGLPAPRPSPGVVRSSGLRPTTPPWPWPRLRPRLRPAFARGQDTGRPGGPSWRPSTSIGFAPPTRIVSSHPFPNVMTGWSWASPIPSFGRAGRIRTGLSWPRTTPPGRQWGGMLSRGLQHVALHPSVVLVPAGLTIALTVLAFNTIGRLAAGHHSAPRRRGWGCPRGGGGGGFGVRGFSVPGGGFGGFPLGVGGAPGVPPGVLRLWSGGVGSGGPPSSLGVFPFFGPGFWGGGVFRVGGWGGGWGFFGLGGGGGGPLGWASLGGGWGGSWGGGSPGGLGWVPFFLFCVFFFGWVFPPPCPGGSPSGGAVGGSPWGPGSFLGVFSSPRWGGGRLRRREGVAPGGSVGFRVPSFVFGPWFGLAARRCEAPTWPHRGGSPGGNRSPAKAARPAAFQAGSNGAASRRSWRSAT